MTAPWMPPLPEPVGEIPYRRPSGMIGRLEGYTNDQMRDYGIACAKAALEAAAGVAELWHANGLEYEIAREIRKLEIET